MVFSLELDLVIQQHSLTFEDDKWCLNGPIDNAYALRPSFDAFQCCEKLIHIHIHDRHHIQVSQN